MRNIILTIVIAGGIVSAQPPRGGGFGPRASSGGGTHTPPTPAQMAQRETDGLTRFFTLTTGQQSAVLGILTNEFTQTAASATQLQTLHTTLVTAVKANNTGLVSSTIQQISTIEEQDQVARANAAGQIYATVLTASQQAQVGQGLGPLMGGPGGRGGPGRGPGPRGFGGRGPQ